jgi:CRP-like cAMP-binding protein
MISGAARRYTMRRNGRREIVDFLLPGNFFGFAHQTQHAFTVEAIVDATYIARYPITPIESMLDPLVVRSVWEATTEETRRLQVRILTLAQLTALERVASFLLEMLVRSPEGPDRILLPMSRYDIADYLAVSVETVCRALTRLKDRGAITFGGTRHIRIADRGLLGNCGAEYPMTILQTLR